MLPSFLTQHDWEIFVRTLKGRCRPADLIIAPDEKPYLYRWHVIPRNDQGNVYLHIQVADDPKRPLHDHPWDNTSNILAGGYDELQMRRPYVPFEANDYWVRGEDYSHIGPPDTEFVRRRPGDVVFRRAETGHRLFLAEDVPYTMTLFTTGPKRRRWGFWYPEGWVDAAEVCVEEDGKSIHRSDR